jgi:hypothetical protein
MLSFLSFFFLLSSAAIHADKRHLGVYASEAEAARAYDRHLLKKKGLEAAPLLNGNLVDYIDMLGGKKNKRWRCMG